MTDAVVTSNADAESSIACSIIIPTRDMLHFLQPCVESVLRTVPENSVEVIVVDNDSQEPETLDFLDAIDKLPQVRVLKWPHTFNFSAINNFAVSESNGATLCFLNNDIEVSQVDWLDKLLTLVDQKNVGAVGCILTYDDHTIQHGGIALDEQSIAKHIALKEPANFFAVKGISEPISVDAVTGACLLMTRKVFQSIGGFNEQDLPVSYNDVDLCLRARQNQLDVLMHPGVCHVHHESVSRKSDEAPANRERAEKEFAFMQSKWKSSLKGRQYTSGLPQQTSSISPRAKKGNRPSQRIRFNASSADYQRLKLENEALQQHITRMEEAHRLIEQSIFWRITYPLRAFKEFLRSVIAGTGNNEHAQLDAESSEITSTDVSEPISTKEQYDDRAKASLLKFLEEGHTIQFPEFEEIELSIVLVFYNQAHLSLLCLQSILEHGDSNYEVVIVDNHSSDDTSALLNQLDNVKISRNTENLGFVRAVNQAAELASGKHLLLLNNDALLEPDTLHSAIETLNSKDEIGAVGAKIKLLDGSLQEAGSIIWQDGACAGYGRGDDPEAPQYMMRRDVDYCSGAFLLFETALFREMNCFDEAFAPAYYEESDFCIRLQQLGYKVVYEPNAQITHYEFASSGGLSGATKLQQEHRDILVSKHEAYLSQRLENDQSNVLAARTANDHPNVLIIDDRVPYPSLGAGYPRCSHILNAVAELPINLTFYPLLYPDESWSDVYELLSPEIEVMLELGQSELQHFLLERKGFYQTIMVSRVHNMEIFNEIVKHEPELIEGVTVIYDAEAVSAPREVLRRRLWGEDVSSAEEQELIATELKEAKSANKVVAVSDQEASLYHQQGIERTVVLGHTLPAEPTSKTFSERQGFLFVGALRDEGSPNVDSLLWFLINCWPLIEKQLPECELFVVGDNTVPSLATADRGNVKFLGRLETIEDYYDSCRVFLAPTRFAAGIPHKVHEAASMGLPSVTTTLLAKQLGWDNNAQLLCADTPEEFVECCTRLHEDEDVWQSVRNAGLDAITNDCSPTVFRENLKQLFEVTDN